LRIKFDVKTLPLVRICDDNAVWHTHTPAHSGTKIVY